MLYLISKVAIIKLSQGFYMFICSNCRFLFREFFIFALTIYSSLFIFVIPWYVVFLLTAIPILISYSTVSSLISILNIFLPLLIFSFFSSNLFALYLYIATWTLITLSVRSGKRWAFLLSYIFIGLLTFLSLRFTNSIADIILITVSLLTVILNIYTIKGKDRSIENIDIIIENDTPTLRQATEIFISGIKEISQGHINIINQSKNNLKISTLSGDGLIIAFDCKAFCPSRKLISEIIKYLPRGNGKYAFILYTGKLYTDMAAFILWVVLLLKGYKPKGKLFVCNYFLNDNKYIHTFNESERNIIFECGGDFADGWYCGEPLTILPTPLFIINAAKK